MQWRQVLTVMSMAVMALGVSAPNAKANIVIFSGGDPGANSTDPRPNSNSTAASFDAATGPNSLITFESAPLGSFTNLTVAPGVTINGTSLGGDPQTIVNTPFATPDSLFGYNTTAGGSQFVQLLGGTLTFSFATPIDAFGAYFTGVQEGGEIITFSDGSSQSIPLISLGDEGGVEFLGFTDFGKSIASVTINVSNDIVGVDDVRYLTAAIAPVPEPSTWGLLATVFVAMVLGLRRKQRNASVS